MRILAVRGQNLASLASEFEIDLAGGALGGAGVFAIVGPTGAGKSTLLDAICVALFDRTPRLTNRSTVVVQRDEDDPAALGSQDVRTILRRGAAAGYAEVDFESGDLRRYRARWSVRRARDRVDGNLQAQQISLVAIDDGVVVERFGGTRTETLDAIHERLGLSFDQFRRSALLAQGEFATFLRADGRDRSELLERMTGTEIYSRLSIGAHLRAKEAAERVHAGRLGADAIELLTEPDRRALDAELVAGRTAAERAHERQTRVDATSRWIAEAIARERARGAAVAARDAARDAHVTAEPLRAELEQRRRAEKLRGVWDEAAGIERRYDAAITDVTRSKAALAAATADHEKANARRAAITTPLDTIRQARVGAKLVERTVPLGETDLGSIAAATTDAAWVAQRAALGPEVATWSDLDPRFAQRAVIADQIAAIEGTLRGHADHRIKLAKQRENVVTDQRAATTKLVEAKARVGGSSKKKAGAGPQTLDEVSRLEDAARTQVALAERLVAIAAGARHAVGVRDELERQLRELAATTAADRAARDEAKQRHATSLVLRDERARVATELRRAGGFEHARAELVDGDPCPLCGATEHPWAERGAFDVMIRDADRLLAQASGAFDAAVAELARLDAREAAQTRDHARLTASHATAADGATSATPIWRDQLRALGELSFDDDPASPAAERIAGEREAAARAALEDARTAREQVAAQIKAASDAAAEIALRQAAVDEISTRLADVDRRLGEIDATIERVKGERVGRIERHAELSTELDAAIARWLAALPPDEKRTLAATRGTRAATGDPHELGAQLDRARLVMTELATAWRTRTELVIEAEAVLAMALRDVVREAAELDREIAESRARHADATTRAAALAEEHAAARTRFDRAREAAGIDDELGADELFAFLADAPARADVIAERLAALDRTLDVATALVEERTGRVVEHVTTARFPDTDDGDIDDALEALAAALATAGDLAAGGDPERPARLAIAMQGRVDALAAACATSAALADRHVADLQAKLAADAKARARRAVALEALADSERAAEVDRMLGEVIGSHDGKLFRSFAQSLTLDGLLAVTNSHLEELAPRYQLERVPKHDLELQVIDRDLGGEVRSVQSLSGGESFLVSLALALGLSSMSANDVRVRTLLIDEGFGTLDPATLDGALAVLDRLQATGRQVGVISHVPALVERVGAHVRIAPRGGGRSDVLV